MAWPGGGEPIGPAFDRLTTTDPSRKGGSILAALDTALRAFGAGVVHVNANARHVICYTDADLSANLALLGALAARIVSGGEVVAALGPRYGIDDAVLIRDDGPTTEPHSTGDKPDKFIILFRHYVRSMLIPPGPHRRHPGVSRRSMHVLYGRCRRR